MPDKVANEEYCYLTTKGRVSGKPHRIEIWFGVSGNTLYMLSGGGRRSDWVKNLMAGPAVDVRIARKQFRGVARLVTETNEDAMARRLLAAKYYKWRQGKPLNDWAKTALAIAVELEV